MKSNLNVQWDIELEKYLIVDISPYILRLFDIQGSVEGLLNSVLSLPTLIKYLDLVRKSNIHYVEFLYDIKDFRYTVKIVEEKKVYTIIFESVFSNTKDIDIQEQSIDIDDSFFADVEGVLTNDKTISEIFALRNATQENINLEILYVVKKVQEQLTELKEDYKEKHDSYDRKIDAIEENYLRKDEFTFYYFLEKIGVKKLLVFIFLISFVETIVIEPFIVPILKQISNSIVEIVD